MYAVSANLNLVTLEKHMLRCVYDVFIQEHLDQRPLELQFDLKSTKVSQITFSSLKRKRNASKCSESGGNWMHVSNDVVRI